MNNEYCYLNGKVVPLAEAKVSILDIGMLRGYGIYDGLTALGDRVFRFADHWQRFVDGAHALNLNIPITEEKCEKVMRELLQKNGYERSIIRIILTGGNTIGGIEYDFAEPTFYIIVEKWGPLPAEKYEKGARLVTYDHGRDWPEVKTINYIRAVNLQNWRKEEDALDILFVHDGEVLECSTSNIFLVKGGKLITPGERMLRGITRKAVMEIMRAGGYEIEERIVEVDELQSADEIFITSSFKDVVPVTKIDDFVVGEGRVGKVTREAMSAFAKTLELG